MEVTPLRRLVFPLASLALLAPHAAGRPAAGRQGDFARAYQEFKTNYLGEPRKAGFVGSSFYLVRGVLDLFQSIRKQ